jgi:probable addiction module antidote protein
VTPKVWATAFQSCGCTMGLVIEFIFANEANESSCCLQAVTNPHSNATSSEQKNWQRKRIMTKIIPFDAAHYLDSEEMIAEYLNQALLSGDSDVLLRAIADVAKARGIAQIAVDTGLGRESLYKALAVGAKPRFETIFKVLNALGLQLQATSVTASHR